MGPGSNAPPGAYGTPATIGGAAGAILGGIIGNNVDKKKKPVP